MDSCEDSLPSPSLELSEELSCSRELTDDSDERLLCINNPGGAMSAKRAKTEGPLTPRTRDRSSRR